MTERDPHPSDTPTEPFGDDDLATESAAEPAEPARTAPADEVAPIGDPERSARRGRITAVAGAAVVLLAALGGSFALGRATADGSDGPGDLRPAAHSEKGGPGGWTGPRDIDHRGDWGADERSLPVPHDRRDGGGDRPSGPLAGPPRGLPDHPGWDCHDDPDDPAPSDTDSSEETDQSDGQDQWDDA